MSFLTETVDLATADGATTWGALSVPPGTVPSRA
jgi:hypothetical protein